MRATTVLWDIDGTLVSSGGVAARAFLDAVAEVTGRRPSPERRDYGGRLDPEIADMLLAAVGAAPAQVAGVLAALERLVAERLGELRAQTRAYPGVAALLGYLARAGVRQTVVGDREGGVWGERGKLHAPRFHGKYYDVEGILPFPRSPQGWPVLVQAGQSPAGIGLAARYAELVFSGPPSLAAAVEFRAELHRQAAAAGRDPGQLLVLPALMITLGGTEAEARARASELDELASPEFRWQNLLYMTGHDPDGFDPDAPLPAELYDGRPLPVSRARPLYDAAREHPGLPLRELARRLSEGPAQNQFAGTPEQLADHVIAWQDAGAVDGFTIMGSTLPRELTTFTEQVVPILQSRGRFRTEYTGSTLRGHLGLDRPAGYQAPGARRLTGNYLLNDVLPPSHGQL